MTFEDLKREAVNWKFTKYKLINFRLGFSAPLVYQLIGRPFYRPFIYSNHIFDFHIADTLGNTLGTIAAIFIPIAVLTNDKTHGYSLIKLISIIVVIYEIGQPLLGKPIDLWDIAATMLTGGICYFIFQWLFNNEETTINQKIHQ
jgi:hypothetical protein